MRAVIQRVAQASVEVGGEVIGRIGRGLLVLLGVTADDGPAEAEWMADKLLGLRIFENPPGKFNDSVIDIGGAVLVVSQFTLYADTRKGRRPSFTAAAPPGVAEPLYEQVVQAIARRGVPVGSGRFGASMQVALVNDGPVTIVLDSNSG
jgi:D-tyrosyl-tRNA(Tyr) deacylase